MGLALQYSLCSIAIELPYPSSPPPPMILCPPSLPGVAQPSLESSTCSFHKARDVLLKAIGSQALLGCTDDHLWLLLEQVVGCLNDSMRSVARSAVMSRSGGTLRHAGSCCGVLCWYPENCVPKYEHACSIVLIRVLESVILSYVWC